MLSPKAPRCHFSLELPAPGVRRAWNPRRGLAAGTSAPVPSCRIHRLTASEEQIDLRVGQHARVLAAAVGRHGRGPARSRRMPTRTPSRDASRRTFRRRPQPAGNGACAASRTAAVPPRVQDRTNFVAWADCGGRRPWSKVRDPSSCRRRIETSGAAVAAPCSLLQDHADQRGASRRRS